VASPRQEDGEGKARPSANAPFDGARNGGPASRLGVGAWDQGRAPGRNELAPSVPRLEAEGVRGSPNGTLGPRRKGRAARERRVRGAPERRGSPSGPDGRGGPLGSGGSATPQNGAGHPRAQAEGAGRSGAEGPRRPRTARVTLGPRRKGGRAQAEGRKQGPPRRPRNGWATSGSDGAGGDGRGPSLGSGRRGVTRRRWRSAAVRDGVGHHWAQTEGVTRRRAGFAAV